MAKLQLFVLLLLIFVIPLLHTLNKLTNTTSLYNVKALLISLAVLFASYKLLPMMNFGSSSNMLRKHKRRPAQLGGLINVGNTCFMNSVIQSLASSQSITSLLAREEGPFIDALQLLLDKLNTKQKGGHDYSTTPLLKTMTRTPDKHFLMGYNQEDAQEFFQTLLNELESDLKKKGAAAITEGDAEDDKKSTTSSSSSLNEAIDNGDIVEDPNVVYIPASQIDPNLANATHKSFPFKLLTPVDGLSAERIGCLTCGEMGGIRYNVISGLSLNLPSDNYASLKLRDLLKEWTKPEIIEGVDCNRCALNHVLQVQKDQIASLDLDKPTTAFLKSKLEERIAAIEQELQKPIIDDDAVKSLYTDKMVQKTSKSKQILLSHPPKLLSMHLNRSVFDPMTYRVRKNNAMVAFPMKLDMDEFIAGVDEINTDARLPMSKKAPPPIAKDKEATEEVSQDKEVESDSEESTEDEDAQDPSGPLAYQLRSVIVHYGTHNYGHYIAYRKHLNKWWRISDEDVDEVEEEEVKGTRGVFMLFYELGIDYTSIVASTEESENESDSEDELVEQDGPPESEIQSDKETVEGQERTAFNIANL